MSREIVVTLPNEELLESLKPAPEGVRFTLWPLDGPAPEPEIDLAVLTNNTLQSMQWLNSSRVRYAQGVWIGFDGVEGKLPAGVSYCNAAGTIEASTAELALTLTLASLRDIPGFVRRQDRTEWEWLRRPALADSTVLVIGMGGVGEAICERLAPFEVTLLRAASSARDDADGHIYGTADLPEILGRVDVVILAVNLNDSTKGFVDDAFLSAMRDGALLVNVARGHVVDQDALLDHLKRGRLNAAVDVMYPEPLPKEHPLWSAPNLLLTPHVGGNTTGARPRLIRLLRTQVERIVAGEAPLNVVLPAK